LPARPAWPVDAPAGAEATRTTVAAVAARTAEEEKR